MQRRANVNVKHRKNDVEINAVKSVMKMKQDVVQCLAEREKMRPVVKTGRHVKTVRVNAQELSVERRVVPPNRNVVVETVLNLVKKDGKETKQPVDVLVQKGSRAVEAVIIRGVVPNQMSVAILSESVS